MYSVVLMAALTAGGGQTPAWFNHGCCGGGCYGGCYGSCYGSGYGSCYGGCWGSSCHGGFLGLRNLFSCHGGCHGWGSCHGGWGCHGSSYACYGSCYGSGYGGCYGSGYGGCWGSSYGAGCYGCGGGGYIAAPGYVTPNIPAPNPAPASGTPATKPTTPAKPMGGTGTSLSQPARVIVSLPADAKLFVDDQPMVSTSATRTFRTPELVPGQVYYYIMRAEIVRNGQPLSETKQILVRAGEQNQITFADLQKADTAKHVAKSEEK